MERSVLLIGIFLSGRVVGVRAGCEDLANHLTEAGWQVITTSNRNSRAMRLYDMLKTTWRERNRYAVANLEVYSGLAFIWAEAVAALLKRLGKPYIVTLQGGHLPLFARRYPGRVRRLLQNAKAVTTPSYYLLETMRDYRADLYLLPNPIDLSFYQFRERPQPGPCLVWLRRLNKIYNPVMAAQVVSLLEKEMPEIQLTMVGRDEGAMAEFQEAVKRLNLTDRINVLGGIPKAEVPTCLDRGDIFLNTTDIDNTPVSVLEAMASGLCVVSTNVDGLPYLLKHEHDALLVPPGDPEAMAASVKRLLTEPGLALRLSTNARRKVELFDWSVVLPHWITLLSDAQQ